MTPNEQITKLVNEAYAAIHKAEEIADEYGEGFSFSLAYGMGGYYEGRMTKERALELVTSGVELTSNQKDAIETALEENDYGDEDNNNGWFASSQGC